MITAKEACVLAQNKKDYDEKVKESTIEQDLEKIETQIKEAIEKGASGISTDSLCNCSKKVISILTDELGYFIAEYNVGCCTTYLISWDKAWFDDYKNKC